MRLNFLFYQKYSKAGLQYQAEFLSPPFLAPVLHSLQCGRECRGGGHDLAILSPPVPQQRAWSPFSVTVVTTGRAVTLPSVHVHPKAILCHQIELQRPEVESHRRTGDHIQPVTCVGQTQAV